MFDKISSYWTSSSSGYDKCIKAQFNNSRILGFWNKLLKKGLDNKSSLKILDVGTGPGFFSILLSRMGNDVTAIDASEGMIETAGKNFREAGVDVKIYMEDASDLKKEKDNFYDTVVSRDVTWTLTDPEGAYKEWLRVLKPGGKIIICDGNYHYGKYSLKRRLWSILAKPVILITEGRIQSSSGFSEEMLNSLPLVSVKRPEADTEMLEKAGFTNIKVNSSIFNELKRTIEHFKYGCQSEKFMITAEKRCEGTN